MDRLTSKEYNEILDSLFVGEQQEKFMEVANKLLNMCFIVKNHPKESMRADYTYIRQRRELFEAVFERILGYTIHFDDSNGVIYLQGKYDSTRMRFKHDETIVILLLCLMYTEERKKLSLADGVSVMAEDIYERYYGMKKKHLKKEQLRDVIRKLRHYNIVYNDKDVGDVFAEIKIFPSILFVLRRDGLEEVYDLQKGLELYTVEDSEDADDDDDEQDS